TPDFEVDLVSGAKVLIEVKPEASMRDAEVKDRLAKVDAYLRRSGHSFVVLTDAELRREPRQSNARTISRSALRIPPSYAAAKVAVRKLSAVLPVSLSVAAGICSSER